MKKTFVLDRVPGAPVSTDDLLSDLQRVSKVAGTNIVSQKLYSELGKYDATTLSRRFGSWNKAVIAASLGVANEINYSDAQLFENIIHLWEHYGRQPRLAELKVSPSAISDSPYKRRFGSWIHALEQFVAQANAEELQAPSKSAAATGRRTSRDSSLRLRFHVLKRDNFTCRACGANPPAKPGLLLQVDHIIPWSNGGETIEDNLQTLCEACNRGKSNVL